MDFLRKHYEKIALAALLVVFAMLLVYLVSVVEGSKDVSDNELTPPVPKVNVKSTDFSDSIFDLKKSFTENTAWNKSNYRPLLSEKSEENLESSSKDLIPAEYRTVYSDLFQPVKLGICPFCKRHIPVMFFADGKSCPFIDCKKSLRTPSVEGTGVVLEGIELSVDAPYGFRKNDAEELGIDYLDIKDIWGDRDADGFSNLHEYLMQTDLNSANSHPDFSDRLEVQRIYRAELPILLNSILDANTVQITVNGRAGMLKLNQAAPPIDGRRYSLVEIRQKNADNPVDSIVLSSGDDTLVLKRGEKVTANRLTADLRDFGSTRYNLRYRASEGREIVLYTLAKDGGQPQPAHNSSSSGGSYKVVKIDEAAQTVTLEDGNSPGRMIVIDKVCRIPENRRVGYVPNKVLPNPNAKIKDTVGQRPGRPPMR